MSGTAGAQLYFDSMTVTRAATDEIQIVSPSGFSQTLNPNLPFLRLLETGDYYIGVRQPSGGSTRDYAFRIVDLAASQTISPPTSLQGTLSGYSAISYQFTGVADALAYLDFFDLPFDTLEGYLANGAGQVGAIDSFAIDAKLPADDTYYLVLDNLTAGDVGLDLRFNVALPTITNLRAEQGDSQPVTYTYDAHFNQLTSISDALGRKTLFDIDPLNGNRLSSTQVVGIAGGDDDVVVRYTYTAHGMVDTLTDALGRITDYDYDALDRLIRVTSAKGTAVEAIESYEYDAAGNVVAYVDASGRRTTYVYDAANRLLRTTQPDPDGAGPLVAPVWQSTYDAAGNRKTSADPNGRATTFEYDRAGRVVKTTDAGGQVATYEYDPAGNLVAQVDRLGRRSRFEYDGRGRVVAFVDPLNKRTTYAYDADDNLISETDPLGHTTSYTYDGRSRVTARIDALGGIQRWRYDLADNIVQTTDEAGRSRQLRYDDLNRQVASIDPLA
ncbi:MAG TPA: hypothetical protein PLV92_22475, partial [Pirellulaceae bacterium]|nr:hypothetical protein [Pirellulaceae bacterium]